MVLRRPDELGLLAHHRFKHRARVVDGQADANRHQERQVLQPDHPLLRIHLALADDVEVGDRGGGRKEQGHVDEQHLVPAHVVADHHRREHQHRQADHQHIVEVRAQVEERFGLHAKRLVRRQDARQQLAAGLNRPLGPAMLLGLERIHLHRQFRRHDDIGHEMELPAAQLGAVAEVQVFGQRVVLPAAAVDNRFAAPDPRGAVEVEEVARAVAPAVLQHEVRVEQDRLDLGEQRVVGVDVAPARLHHGDLRIHEVVDGLVQEVGRRQEVGVENRDELALGDRHPCLERTRLEAGAIGAVEIRDVEPLRGGAADGQLRNRSRLVGRVVQHLHFEAIAWVVHQRDGIYQPVHHVHLVVDRQLHGHDRQLFKRARSDRHPILVLHVGIDQVVAMPPVAGQH